jgi:hypothetical protein
LPNTHGPIIIIDILKQYGIFAGLRMEKVLRMARAWNKYLRVLTLVTVAVWFQTASHNVLCHSDNASCEDSASETVCSCICHSSIDLSGDLPACIVTIETAHVPSQDEILRALLLPTDIFRPPLTIS